MKIYSKMEKSLQKAKVCFKDYEQMKQKIVDEYVQPIEALLQKIKEEVIDRDNIWNYPNRI